MLEISTSRADCNNCHACLRFKANEQGIPLLMSRMVLCPDCGNKRCPKASDHELACTQSNEPGQIGSVYLKNPLIFAAREILKEFGTSPPAQDWIAALVRVAEAVEQVKLPLSEETAHYAELVLREGPKNRLTLLEFCAVARDFR